MTVKITDMTALSTEPATSDLFVIVDVSDTSQAATGTVKKITWDTLLTHLNQPDSISDQAGNVTSLTPGVFYRLTSASLQTVTINTADFDTLKGCWLYKTGSGTVTVTAGGSETLNDSGDGLTALGQYTMLYVQPLGSGAFEIIGVDGQGANERVELMFAVGDETTALTTGTGKLTFRMPYAMTLTDVRASVVTAPTGAALTVDINESGTTILSTKLTIDATEKTSATAATAAVISDSALADDAEMTIDIDQVGSTVAGAGLKVTLIGTRA